jgi:hypothetical protein
MKALGVLCRYLREPIDPPSEGATVFATSDVVWGDVVRVAVELWLAPTLWCALDRASVELPHDSAEHLREYYRINTLRNLRFRRQCVEVVDALNGVGVVPLLLKGGVNLANGSTQPVGERFMHDIDIAIPAESGDRSLEALDDLGYTTWEPEPGTHPFEVTLLKRGAPGALDVHLELGVQPIPSMLPMSEVWLEGSDVAIGGAVARVLSPTHQVLHNIVHSLVQDMDHLSGAMPLRQIVTLAHLARTHGRSIDWAAISRTMDAHGFSSTYRDHLWLAHQLVGLSLPEQGPGGVRERFHVRRSIANFGFIRSAHLQRRILLGFESRRMVALYGPLDHPLGLTKVRCRHATRIVRRDGLKLVREVVDHTL